MEIIDEFKINSTSANLRLDNYLLTKLELSRQKIQLAIKKQQVTINKRQVKPAYKLKIGDVIDIKIKFTEPEECWQEQIKQDLNIEIIYQDEHIAIINKPTNMVMYPAAGWKCDTLVNYLMYQIPEIKKVTRYGIIHRLDKNTCGLLVWAKTIKAYNKLIAMMKDRQIKKKYLALVYGSVYQAGKIEQPIKRHETKRKVMTVAYKGKYALTEYQPIEIIDNLTLLDINLRTGRTHQIRVHCKHAGFPLVGDDVYYYKVKKNLMEAEKFDLCINYPHQVLQAYSLEFNHPIDDKPLLVKAPVNQNIKTLLIKLGFSKFKKLCL